MSVPVTDSLLLKLDGIKVGLLKEQEYRAVSGGPEFHVGSGTDTD